MIPTNAWAAEGEAAFPSGTPEGTHPHQYGMSFRDYIAVQAMVGAAANPHIFDVFMQKGKPGDTLGSYLARHSYLMADEMLKARSK